ncbi:hypothetical protein IQ238_25620 [Pleurocapsales cyanobacterium LEGE 06147]|nr:hypothetical protein [Pleurocapsales cyanobacterium LEGE 06147]
MKNLISSAIANTISSFKKLSIERLFAAVLVGILVLVTNVNPVNAAQSDRPIGERIAEQQHQSSRESDRPKTTGEWNRQAREVEGEPGERLERIGEQSAEAFKQFGEGVTKSIQETARDVGSGVKETSPF